MTRDRQVPHVAALTALITACLALVAGCVDLDALRARRCTDQCQGDAGAQTLSDAGEDAARLEPMGDASRDSDGAGPSDAQASDDAGEETDAAVSDAAQITVPACADRHADVLGSYDLSTVGAGDDVTLSCATGTGNDTSTYFIVPQTGFYEITTTGSAFSTTLALTSPTCDGTELACVNGGSMPGAEILQKLSAGDEYVIVVDGNSGAEGEAKLSIERITCPAVDLAGQTLPLTATTAFGRNTHDGACGGAGQREMSYVWTAPADGLYAFRASSDDFDPALYVERGPRCGGTLLGCNAGAKGFVHAQVTRRVLAGEHVTLIVDSTSGEGEFTLSVEALSANGCPNREYAPLEDPPIAATIANADSSVMTGSCSGEKLVMMPGGTSFRSEHSYLVLVPSGYGCTFWVEADDPVALYVLEGGDCGGAERSCELSTQDAPPYAVSVTLGDPFAGGSSTWVLVVEPFFASIEYSLTAGCFLP